MSVRQLSRRLDRMPVDSYALHRPQVWEYVRWQAAVHGVDPEELLKETEAVLTTWRRQYGKRLPRFEDLLVEEARATARSVTAVRTELLAEIAAWERGGR